MGFPPKASFWDLLVLTVGTYSEGNLLVVYEMRRQVLPTAPSPTTTHLMVCIVEGYLYCTSICNRTKNATNYSHKSALSTRKICTWVATVQHQITITWTVLGLFIHIPRITSEMQRTRYAVKTPPYIMNFKLFYKREATSAWQFKTATFINTILPHKLSIFQPFIYFSSSLQYFALKIWYARTITSIHVDPQYACWNTQFLLLPLLCIDEHVIKCAGKTNIMLVI